MLHHLVVEVQILWVKTYADGYLADTQMVATVDALKDNDCVLLTGTGNLDEASYTLLTGGTNGKDLTDYDEYFEALEVEKWNTMADQQTMVHYRMML